MEDKINNTIQLLPITNEKMKSSVEKLLIVRDLISANEEKIQFQDDEMLKTKKMIEEYQEYYDAQKNALEHFCSEKRRLSAECETLIVEINEIQKEEVSEINKNNINIINNNLEINKISDNVEINDDSTLISSKLKHENDVSQSISKVSSKKKHSKNFIKNKKNKNIQATKNTIEILNKIKNGITDMRIKSKKENTTILNGKKSKKRKIIEKKKKVLNRNTCIALKITSTPLNKLIFVDVKYQIEKIYKDKDRLFLCGSGGFLAQQTESHLINYIGHNEAYVYNFYIYKDLIVSLGFDYILVHQLKDIRNYKLISSFTSAISASCLYKSIIYGTLVDGMMFIINLDDNTINFRGPIFPDPLKSIVVFESKQKLYLVVVKLNGEISRYCLNDEFFHPVDVGKVDGTPKGFVTDGNMLVCCTDHKLYFVNKKTWHMDMIRETLNEISHAEMCLNKVILLDTCNILHKYIIKKGLISNGSTVESLSFANKVSALHVCATDKKVFFSCLSDVYYQKL